MLEIMQQHNAFLYYRRFEEPSAPLLGWIEGENVVIEQTYADGHPERLPGLAAVLARVPYDLVVASGSDAVRALPLLQSP
jgi:hypothetical protein